ncbi:MAG: glycogen synthase [Candidatus Berkelbacteria bacterium]
MIKKVYKEKMRICHIASELTPIAKAGGLGDIVGSLPKEISEKFEVESRVFLPKYKSIDMDKYPAELIMRELKVEFPDGKFGKVNIWKTLIPFSIVPVYLVESEELFTGKEIYDHNIVKAFSGLAKVALEVLKALDWRPDVIQCHDAMMAMAIKWLKTTYKNDPFYRSIATVLTIHNLLFQNSLPIKEAKSLSLKKSDFAWQKKYKLDKTKINLMAEGIENATMVNTVSPNYARETMTKKYGCGLNKLLSHHKDKYTGILNGIDYSSFDPRYNEDTPVKYWIPDLDRKVENKMFLQKKFGLIQSPDLPLICVISRLTNQKGLDLIEDVLKDLMDMGAQFIILGSGSEKIEKVFIKAEKDYPKAIEAEMEFDASLAQTIYAGADMLLMPSRFEPCGLSQIIAMRFGTIPIVRRTGGLADTVHDGYTGFVFNDYDKNAFLWAIRRAVDVYYNQKDHWRKMQIMAMEKDFSWTNSAKKYIWLYKKAIKKQREFLKNDNENN